jgi:hypothetical protein
MAAAILHPPLTPVPARWKELAGQPSYVFLIGYGVVAGFNVEDEKPPHD